MMLTVDGGAGRNVRTTLALDVLTIKVHLCPHCKLSCSANLEQRIVELFGLQMYVHSVPLCVDTLQCTGLS